MPELGPLGSVRGALSNECPYRDPLRARTALAAIRRTELGHALARFDPGVIARRVSEQE